MSTDGFRPRYPGLCDFSSQPRSVLVGTMDVRDYVDALSFQILMSSESSNIVIRGESSVSLIPGVSVNPTSTPQSAATFTPFAGRPTLISFDMELSTGRLLLHFDGLMDQTSVDITQLVLSDTAPTPTNSFYLTGGSLTQNTYVTTLCITLSSADATVIAERGICQSSCYCSITDQFITDFGNRVVQAELLQVFDLLIDQCSLSLFGCRLQY